MIHENEIMTAGEVADYLRLTEATVYKLAQAGEILATKVGRTWRFRQDLIDAWFRAACTYSPLDKPPGKEPAVM